jgi:hypothetical protein
MNTQPRFKLQISPQKELELLSTIASGLAASGCSNPPQEPQKPASEPEIVRIPLDSNQLERVAPILDVAKSTSRLEGIFCTLSRAYSPVAGTTVLELQVMRLDRRIANAVRKLLRD